MTDMRLVFLGTNGWYATPLANTVCALIETPKRYIVLDAGDGIWRLDEYAVDSSKPIDIFLSHFHLDHTIGLHIQPKFRLMKNKIRIFGMPGTKKWLGALVASPYTASYDMLRKSGFDVQINELREGDNRIDEYSVRCAPLVHADPCWGYRFELGGKTIAYCTDTGPCENLGALAKNADILITECGLMSGQPSSPSWPHLNPEMAAQAAKDAGAGHLYLTHFAANLCKTKGDRLQTQAAARRIFSASTAAVDRMSIRI